MQRWVHGAHGRPQVQGLLLGRAGGATRAAAPRHSRRPRHSDCCSGGPVQKGKHSQPTFSHVPLRSSASFSWQYRLVLPPQQLVPSKHSSFSLTHLQPRKHGTGSAECGGRLARGHAGHFVAWGEDMQDSPLVGKVPSPAATHRHCPAMHRYPGVQHSLLDSQPYLLSGMHCRPGYRRVSPSREGTRAAGRWC